MSDEKEEAALQLARYHLDVREQAARAREHYEATGERLALVDVPQLNLTRCAASFAVQYAAQAIPLISDLPKRFTWLGSDYLLIFPPDDAPVQIADPHTHQNLCVGLPGWTDPQMVRPKART
jgi:hypothetical protein